MSTPLKTLLASLAMALTLFGLTACGEDGDGSESADSAESSEGAQAEADLSGIPDVVATVDDEEITKAEFTPIYEAQFQQASQQAEMTGQPVDEEQLKQQTAEGLVSNELLLQEADERGFSASEKKVEKSLEQFVQQSGAGSKKKYFEQLAEQGYEEDEVRSQLGDQVVVDQLIAEVVGDDKPSTKELRTLYDQTLEQQKALQEQQPEGQGQQQELPSFKQMRPQLEQQAQAQKESEAAQTLITELRKSADVEINL